LNRGYAWYRKPFGVATPEGVFIGTCNNLVAVCGIVGLNKGLQIVKMIRRRTGEPARWKTAPHRLMGSGRVGNRVLDFVLRR